MGLLWLSMSIKVNIKKKKQTVLHSKIILNYFAAHLMWMEIKIELTHIKEYQTGYKTRIFIQITDRQVREI